MSDALYLNTKDNQLVLFADIIGFSNAVYENEKVTMEDKGKLIVNFPLIYEDFSEKYSIVRQDEMGIKFLWVSDSIIITTPKENANSLFEVILDLTNGLLVSGLSLRGAIALGNVHHEKNIWGTAYIEAVRTEGSIAVYPRIVIRESVVDALETRYKDFMTKSETPEYMQFDYFDCYFDMLMQKGSNIISNISVYESFIINSYNKATKPEHIEKYVWLAQELAKAIAKHSDYIDKYVTENEKRSVITTGPAVLVTSHKQFLEPLRVIGISKIRI